MNGGWRARVGPYIGAIAAAIDGAAVFMGLVGIYIWQKAFSPWVGEHCRYFPTCSQYAREALQRRGFIKGTVLALRRIARCSSLFPGGVDPVPGAEGGNSRDDKQSEERDE